MTARSILVLAGIAVLVAGLALLRPARRAAAPSPPAADVPAALPRVLDFGRDT